MYAFNVMQEIMFIHRMGMLLVLHTSTCIYIYKLQTCMSIEVEIILTYIIDKILQY